MAIPPVSSTNTNNSNNAALAAVTTNTTANAGNTALGINDFLKLLSVQMQSQDPLNPTSDTEFISQMASFTSLQQMSALNTSMTSYIGQQQPVDAQSYIGKQVSLTDTNGNVVSGTVSGVTVASGSAPQIVVNGSSYDPSTITSIQPAGSTVPSTTSSN